MARCDWCESLIGVRHYVQTPEGLKDVYLCAGCRMKLKEIPRDMVESLNDPTPAHHGNGPYSSTYSTVGLFKWLVPRMMD